MEEKMKEEKNTEMKPFFAGLFLYKISYIHTVTWHLIGQEFTESKSLFILRYANFDFVLFSLVFFFFFYSPSNIISNNNLTDFI